MLSSRTEVNLPSWRSWSPQFHFGFHLEPAFYCTQYQTRPPRKCSSIQNLGSFEKCRRVFLRLHEKQGIKARIIKIRHHDNSDYGTNCTFRLEVHVMLPNLRNQNPKLIKKEMNKVLVFVWEKGSEALSHDAVPCWIKSLFKFLYYIKRDILFCGEFLHG